MASNSGNTGDNFKAFWSAVFIIGCLTILAAIVFAIYGIARGYMFFIGLALGIILLSISAYRLSKRLWDESSAPTTTQPSVIYVEQPRIVEREVIKEVVKVPCQYCGTLVDVTATKCPGCGAPLTR